MLLWFTTEALLFRERQEAYYKKFICIKFMKNKKRVLNFKIHFNWWAQRGIQIKWYINLKQYKKK